MQNLRKSLLKNTILESKKCYFVLKLQSLFLEMLLASSKTEEQKHTRSRKFIGYE